MVGWSMKTSADRSLVIDALEMTCLQRPPQAGNAIFHSDHGSQYARLSECDAIVQTNIFDKPQGNCWDNAVTETLFGSLNVEHLHGKKFMTVRAAKDAVIRWILLV